MQIEIIWGTTLPSSSGTFQGGASTPGGSGSTTTTGGGSSSSPGPSGGSTGGSATSGTGSTTAGGASNSTTSGSPSGSTNGSSGSTGGTGGSTAPGDTYGAGSTLSCLTPTMTTYKGLPVAPCGPLFDATLDQKMGTLDSNSTSFTSVFALGPGSLRKRSIMGRQLAKRVNHRRWGWRCGWCEVSTSDHSRKPVPQLINLGTRS